MDTVVPIQAAKQAPVKTPLVFGGATDATNTAGNSIRINWTPGTGMQSYRIYEVLPDGQAVLRGTAPRNATSYTVTGLTGGNFYNFKVNAIDSDGESDGNSSIVGAMAYPGVSSVNVTGPKTATLLFPAATQGNAINVYCRKKRTIDDFSLYATLPPDVVFSSLSDLESGMSYECKVVAVSPLGREDNNTKTVSFTTNSLTETNYKGIQLVQAYGDAPTAYNGQATNRKVVLTWPHFLGASGTTGYAVFRVIKGGKLDTTTLLACTVSTDSSCKVGETTGGSRTLTDTMVGSPPKQYDYVVVLKINGYTEELPQDNSAYRVTVAIPPQNMVLVNRESVNYEICTLMGRATDPLMKNRCPYSGIGAVPKNSNPGNPDLDLDPNYYDFGYNLFVDRWEVACNWTPGPGACTNTNANGDCFRDTAPTADPPVVAPDGAVFHVSGTSTNNTCWVNAAGTWRELNSTAVPPGYRAISVTTSPSKTHKKPPVHRVIPSRAWDTCQSVVDESYGPKRLMRRREFIAAAAWPTVPGDPGFLSDSEIGVLENGDGTATSHSPEKGFCNSDNAAGLRGTYEFNHPDSERVHRSDTTLYSVTIGSYATNRCVSRYGAQDLVGNMNEINSDTFVDCSTATYACNGGISLLDNGNSDLVGYALDGVIGPLGASGVKYINFHEKLHANYFNVPMGLPLLGIDGGNAMEIAPQTNPAVQTLATSKFHGDSGLLYFYINSWNRVTISGGRWSAGSRAGRFKFYLGSGTGSGDNNDWGFRCALPAD